MKRIYFIISGENLFHPHYFAGVLKKLKKTDYKIVGITIPRENYPRGIIFFAKKQFFLWGLMGFTFIAVVDRVKGIFSSIKTIANSNSIPVIETMDVNSSQHIKYLKKLNIDIIISSQGQIFKKELLTLPKIACLNRHTSLLPLFGGSMPVFWAMAHKEKNFGVSVHFMVEKVDAGNILSQEVIQLHKKNSLFKNYLFAFDKSIIATIKALKNLERHKIVKKFYKNDKQYFSFPSFAIIKEFKETQKTFVFSDVIDFFKFLKTW